MTNEKFSFFVTLLHDKEDAYQRMADEEVIKNKVSVFLREEGYKFTMGELKNKK